VVEIACRVLLLMGLVTRPCRYSSISQLRGLVLLLIAGAGLFSVDRRLSGRGQMDGR
jgi:uncharacterized membrane protein YphA (DoxX/SURF4 family)